MGYNVYSVNFIENSAQCFHTASFVCLAVNTIGTTLSHPLELYVKCNRKQHPNYLVCFGINYKMIKSRNGFLIFFIQADRDRWMIYTSKNYGVNI